MTTLGIRRDAADAGKAAALAARIRQSDRVVASVKEKTDDELLEHYRLGERRLSH